MLAPATCVEVRNGLRIRRSCAPILAHPATLLSNSAHGQRQERKDGNAAFPALLTRAV